MRCCELCAANCRIGFIVQGIYMVKLKKMRLTQAAAAALVLLALQSPQAASAGERMTKEKIIEYYKRFNEGDSRYSDLLADDVVFPHISGKTFNGKKEVLDYYGKLWKAGVKEIREPVMVAVDNENGVVAVELTFHITADPGTMPTLPTGETIRPGEEWQSHSVLFYGIKDGKITSIRGALSGPSKLVKVK